VQGLREAPVIHDAELVNRGAIARRSRRFFLRTGMSPLPLETVPTARIYSGKQVYGVRMTSGQ